MKSMQWLSASLLLFLVAAAARAQNASPVRFEAKGSAFSAEAAAEETYTRADGTQHHRRWSTKLFRDSQGRFLLEQHPNGPESSHAPTIIIFDPVRQVEILLFPQLKTARVGKLLPGWANANHALGSVISFSGTKEDLGSKEMEGYKVSGTRFSSTGHHGMFVREEWFSTNLGITLLTTVDGPHGKSSNRVFNIRAGDPEPSVFEIPEGYTVKDMNTPL